jgi:hypothetical protein
VAPDVRPRLTKEPHKLLPGVHGGGGAGAGFTNRAAPDSASTPAACNSYPPHPPGG